MVMGKLLGSQSPIRVVRAVAHYNDPFARAYRKRHGVSARTYWRECWVVAGGRNPVPGILRAIDIAIDGMEREDAECILYVLADEIAIRRDSSAEF